MLHLAFALLLSFQEPGTLQTSYLVQKCKVDPDADIRSVLTAAGATVIFLGGSAKLAQLGGAITAALAAAAVVMPVRLCPRPGLVPVVAVLLPGLLVSALFDTHSEVPRLSYVLPVFTLLGLDQVGQTSGAVRVRFVMLIFLILAAAVGFAYWAEPIDWREVFAPAEPQP